MASVRNHLEVVLPPSVPRPNAPWPAWPASAASKTGSRSPTMRTWSPG